MEFYNAYQFGVDLALRAFGIDKQASEDNNWALPAAIGLGLGAGVYGAARFPALREKLSPVLTKLRAKARGNFIRTEDIGSKPSVLTKIKDYIKYGPTAYDEKDILKLTKKTKGKVPVFSGQVERKAAPGTFDVGHGPGEGGYERAQKLENKWEQYQFLKKYAPDTAARTIHIGDFMKERGLQLRPGENFAEDVAKLQQALGEEFKNTGYLIKPIGPRPGGDLGVSAAGKFLTESSNVPEEYSNWLKMRDKFLSKAKDAEDLDVVINQFRGKKGYAGRLVDEIIHNNAIVQEKLPLIQHDKKIVKALRSGGFNANKEYRVHAFGGRADPLISVPRYSVGANPAQTAAEIAAGHDAARWAQKNFLDKIPEAERGLMYGMDVAPIQGGGYKIIELNPGTESGFLGTVPGAQHRMYQQVTGRHTVPMASALAAGAAIPAAAATYGLTKKSFLTKKSLLSPRMALPLIGGAAGAGIGALADDEDRRRGALLGMLTGLGASAGGFLGHTRDVLGNPGMYSRRLSISKLLRKPPVGLAIGAPVGAGLGYLAGKSTDL